MTLATPPLSTAANLRQAIGDLGFNYGVRFWRDGEVSADSRAYENIEKLAARLREMGFSPRHSGSPGTEGYRVLIIREAYKQVKQRGPGQHA